MPLTGGNLPRKEKDCCLLLDGLEKNYRGAPEVFAHRNAPKDPKSPIKQTDRF
jgi:hypothetical protein